MKCMHAGCCCGIRDARFGGTHWICTTHRATLGESLLLGRTVITEFELLRVLLFQFPDFCGRHEARARIFYVFETLASRDKARAVLRAHGMLGVRVTARVTRIDVIELVTELVAFIFRHSYILMRTHRRREELVAMCVHKSREWYHALIVPAEIRDLMRAERLVYLIRRERGGTEICLVRADFALAFGIFPRDVADAIYVAYVAAIAKSEDRRRAELARFASSLFGASSRVCGLAPK